MRTLHAVNAEEWAVRMADPEGRYRLSHRYLIALRRILARQPERWLDIGAGNGFLAAEVKKRQPGVYAIGLDFVQDVLDRATSLDEAHVHDLNAAPLPIADGSVSFVTCLEVLEHVLFPSDVLGEIQRVLRPGGRALLSVPNLQFIEYVLQLGRGRMPHPAADERHLSVFTLRHLEELAGKAGLRPVKRFGVDASPPFLAHVSRRLFAKTIMLEVKKPE